MKLHGLRPGLPGKVISFHIVPLDPAYPAKGGTGHVPVTTGFPAPLQIQRSEGTRFDGSLSLQTVWVKEISIGNVGSNLKAYRGSGKPEWSQNQ